MSSSQKLPAHRTASEETVYVHDAEPLKEVAAATAQKAMSEPETEHYDSACEDVQKTVAAATKPRESEDSDWDDYNTRRARWRGSRNATRTASLESKQIASKLAEVKIASKLADDGEKKRKGHAALMDSFNHGKKARE